MPALDLTAELVTHRFTPGSKRVLLAWYPQTRLQMDEQRRSVKRNRFGATTHVYRREVMAELRSWFESNLAERLPQCRIFYWT